MLKVGIAGLPNVGKSTLFNALLRKQVALAANYPFATIEPNVGIIEVPDSRLSAIAPLVHTTIIIPAMIEFFDIAGLVRGASQGEGLGNTFLSHIRETSLICHVVRFFQNEDITHVDTHVDPARDIQTIETELMLADLAMLSSFKQPRQNAPKEEHARWNAVQKAVMALDKGTPIRTITWTQEERELLKMFNLLTAKPVLYMCNVSEDQLLQAAQTEADIMTAFTKAGISKPRFVTICAHMEAELAALDPKEQEEYLAQCGLTETGLNRFITTAYSLLDLISYITAGEKEVRAWTVGKGTHAPQAAGVIHTDFEKHFIKAEVVPYTDFIEAGGWPEARSAGKMILAGKEYIMNDGDVVEFKIGRA